MRGDSQPGGRRARTAAARMRAFHSRGGGRLFFRARCTPQSRTNKHTELPALHTRMSRGPWHQHTRPWRPQFIMSSSSSSAAVPSSPSSSSSPSWSWPSPSMSSSLPLPPARSGAADRRHCARALAPPQQASVRQKQHHHLAAHAGAHAVARQRCVRAPAPARAWLPWTRRPPGVAAPCCRRPRAARCAAAPGWWCGSGAARPAAAHERER